MLESIMVHVWVVFMPRFPLMQSTAIIVESVEKYISISSTHGGFKILP